MTRLPSRSLWLAAFVALAGPPDLLTRFARRSSPPFARSASKGEVAETGAAEGGVIVEAGGGQLKKEGRNASRSVLPLPTR